jgi:hypothetical protein
MATLANTDVFTCPLCVVTARPARIAPPRLGSEIVEPATGVQVTPSAEV